MTSRLNEENERSIHHKQQNAERKVYDKCNEKVVWPLIPILRQTLVISDEDACGNKREDERQDDGAEWRQGRGEYGANDSYLNGMQRCRADARAKSLHDGSDEKKHDSRMWILHAGELEMATLRPTKKIR